MEPLKFVVPPGIGDISWICSKLVGLGHPLEIIVPHSNHDRALPYLQLLPAVASCEYARVPNPAKRKDGKVGHDWTRERLIEEASRRAVPIELNTWLEAGRRIEGFMPELFTDHHCPIDITHLHLYQADGALRDMRHFICLYCANRSTVKRWGGWQREQWGELADLLWKAFRLDGFVLLGADWDRPFADEVLKELRHGTAAPPVVDLVGKLPIGATLEVVRRSAYLVAFPSGIPILAAVMGQPVLMFYPKHLEPMHDAWADPEMIRSGAYKAMQFCPPQQAFEWIRDGYKLCQEAPHV